MKSNQYRTKPDRLPIGRAATFSLVALHGSPLLACRRNEGLLAPNLLAPLGLPIRTEDDIP